MPSLRRKASATDNDPVEDPTKKPTNAAEALALAEEAEAEAAEAEAAAAAARARARAIRLRREAQTSESSGANGVAAEAATEPAVAEPEPDVDSDAEPESAENTEGDTVVVEKSDIAATEVADAPEIAPEAVTAPSGRRWGLILAIVGTTVALLCTAALVVLSLIMLGRNGAVSEEQKLNAEYAAAGRQSVVTLMSLDFNKAQENVQQIIDNSTGQFKTDFENQADDFVKVAQDSKVVTDVSVTAAAVDSMNQDSAVVLVAATSRVTNAAGAKQEPRAWRLSVNLKREGGQIKMEKVEFVP